MARTVELRCCRGACGVVPGENRRPRQVREWRLRGAPGPESPQQLRHVKGTDSCIGY